MWDNITTGFTLLPPKLGASVVRQVTPLISFVHDGRLDMANAYQAHPAHPKFTYL